MNFSANKNKSKTVISSYTAQLSIHIGLSIVDKNLLYFIQEKLGGRGTVYLYPHRNEVHYCIMRRDLLVFIEKVFSENSLLNNHPHDKCCLLKQILVNNLTNYKTKKEVDSMKSIITKVPSAFRSGHKHIIG